MATGSVRQSWCAQAKQGLQGEEVKRASDSFEANTVFQLDMVAGLSGQAKEDKKAVWPSSIWRPAERLQGVDSLKRAGVQQRLVGCSAPNL